MIRCNPPALYSARHTLLLAVVLPLLLLPPATSAAPAAVPDSIVQRDRRFVEQLSARQFAEVMPLFDSMMTNLMSVENLRDTWDRVISKAGRFQRISGVRSDTLSGYDLVFVACVFEHGTLDIKVVTNRNGRIAGFFLEPHQEGEPYHAPSYANASAYREHLVTIGHRPWLLHGTLAEPLGNGPFPAVVLVHGSGPEDRDETIGPNKPFRDLAQGLASRGIAVLRYEKRTKELAAEVVPGKDSFTVKEETIDDALAAIQRLRGRDEINPKRIFVLGHSLGGTLAPRIAQGDSSIAGLVILAGATRPLEDNLLEQMEYLSGGRDSEDGMLARLRRQVAAVKSPALSRSTPDSLLPLDVPAAYWLDLRGYDPAAAAARLTLPMLILQGGRDYQVTKRDYDRWATALGDRHNVALHWYPELNHLFIEGTGTSQPSEYQRAGNVSKKVIDDIANWVLAR